MKFTADEDGLEYEATFYLHERDAIGFRPLCDKPSHWPRTLGAFVPGHESDDEDSGWRSGPCLVKVIEGGES
jgi:hypothetical protein